MNCLITAFAEATISPLAVGNFNTAHALNTRNNDPATTNHPWNKDRDGFVIGEGAGVMVLEEYEHAKARGARIYAELADYGMNDDTYHITTPDTNGPKHSMLNALHNATLNPQNVQYINAHNTSTPLDNKNETNTIKIPIVTGKQIGRAHV